MLQKDTGGDYAVRRSVSIELSAHPAVDLRDSQIRTFILLTGFARKTGSQWHFGSSFSALFVALRLLAFRGALQFLIVVPRLYNNHVNSYRAGTEKFRAEPLQPHLRL